MMEAYIPKTNNPKGMKNVATKPGHSPDSGGIDPNLARENFTSAKRKRYYHFNSIDVISPANTAQKAKPISSRLKS